MTLLGLRKHRVLCGLLVLAIISVGYLINQPYIRTKSSVAKAATPLTPQQFTDESLKLRNLVKQKGVKETFAYVNAKIRSDRSYAKSCHPLLHTLGNSAYFYSGGYHQALTNQSEICNSGYTHGVLEAYLDDSPDIKQATATACGPDSVKNFAQWQCFHGIGHGVMLVSQKNITPSIELCKTLPSKFGAAACANGVFMEHFIVNDHGGNIPSVNPTSLDDCVNKEIAYKTDCYSYAPTGYLTTHDGQYKDALNWCKSAESYFVAACIAGVGSQTMKENITEPTVSKQICLSAQKKYRPSCVVGAVNMYIYFSASSKAAQSLCRNEFNAYDATCRAVISDAQTSLAI